ncbi:MAG: sasA 1 [Firmicutes bacterium]|nr:sasA 1 [Bacillota bacterium]
MKGYNLATTLNVKIITVVFFLIITSTAYNHWLSLKEENEKNIQTLLSITDLLLQNKPFNAFSELPNTPDDPTNLKREQTMALNEKLQPILNDIFIPMNTIKFGFYSKQCESIVAIGPQPDKSLLIDTHPNQIYTIYKNDTEHLFRKNKSILWHGANALTCTKPIEENGITVGYVFATVNEDAVSLSIWKRTANTFLGAFLMLLVCITIFRELFVKLKKDLQLFAESIHSGHSYDYRSEIAEFSPILNYISEQTEKMTRLDRLNIIGEMAAGIAHEIRNPMTTVRGLLQFIGNKKEFANQKENFSLMISELDRANSIITEFLSLAKNRAMDFSENNLNTIIQDLYPLLQSDALCNNCDIKLNLNMIPLLPLDRNSIHQLLFNMVRNGLDAMPTNGNGIITISTEMIDGKVQLSIKDSGVGIPLELKDKLGTPFFTTKENGTGLGLAICYRIAQRHNAILTVDSELGKGTTFTIQFNPTFAEPY